MTHSVKLLATATAVPSHVLRQSEVAAAADEIFGDRYEEFGRMSRVFSTAGVRKRHAARPIEWFRNPRGWPERTAVYLEAAGDLFVECARGALTAAELNADEVDTVVTVSSTGIATCRFALKRKNAPVWFDLSMNLRISMIGFSN
jgi:alkylresorcinol/alkylpyrone synthase